MLNQGNTTELEKSLTEDEVNDDMYERLDIWEAVFGMMMKSVCV